MFKNKRILVVVAHPDDELLGLGATMHKLINEYHVTVRVVILGEGITSRSDVRDVKRWEKELTIHHTNVENARKVIGYDSVKTYNFSDNRFDSHALLDIVKVIEREKKEFNPSIIFTHNGSDLNIDHQITFQAVVTATRPIETENVTTIISFETPSATEWHATTNADHFAPNFFIEVSQADVEAKCKAMECYTFEKRAFPHPRSAEALRTLATFRGIQVGCHHAEAFQLIRTVIKDLRDAILF